MAFPLQPEGKTYSAYYGDRLSGVVGDLLIVIAVGDVVWLVALVLQYLQKNFYKFSWGVTLLLWWHPFALPEVLGL
jgi:hypothetical protein